MTNDDYNDEYEEPQDLLGLEKALKESSKIVDSKKRLIKDLLKHYNNSLSVFLSMRFNSDYEAVLAQIRNLKSIVSWIKLEKKSLKSLLKRKKRKNKKTNREEKILAEIEDFLKKAEEDKEEHIF